MKKTIKENELKEIISKTIKKYLKEEKTLLTTTYHNQNLIVKNYDIENDEDREFIFKNKDLIWDILVNSYASLGGFKGFKTQKDMLKKCPFYRLGFCDNEIITVTVYNDYLTDKSDATKIDALRQYLNHQKSVMALTANNIKIKLDIVKG